MSRDQIYAVLMALHDDTMLLPNAAVAEVLARDALRGSTGGPAWLLGHCEWNNRRVPVIPVLLPGAPAKPWRSDLPKYGPGGGAAVGPPLRFSEPALAGADGGRASPSATRTPAATTSPSRSRSSGGSCSSRTAAS